jgi:hypothetical protein
VSETSQKRGGLNTSEAAIAWAYARFGGDVAACGVLEGDAAKAVRAVTEPVLTASDQEQAQLVEMWRGEDRAWDSLEQVVSRLEPADVESQAEHMSPRWQNALRRIVGAGDQKRRKCPWHDNSVRTRRAIVWLALGSLRRQVVVERGELEADQGFDLEHLVDMAPIEREAWIRQLGVFQLAELARKQDRRSLVRLRRALQANDRAWFDACIKRERDVDRLERGRVRELFLSISRQEPDLTVRLLHLGLYSVAASAGTRFAERLASVAKRLPSTLETLLGYYHRLDQRDAPSSLAPAVRRSLDDYVQRRAEDTGAHDE